MTSNYKFFGESTYKKVSLYSLNPFANFFMNSLFQNDRFVLFIPLSRGIRSVAIVYLVKYNPLTFENTLYAQNIIIKRRREPFFELDVTRVSPWNKTSDRNSILSDENNFDQGIE